MKLDDGTMHKADAVNVNAVGDKTTLSLRPERIEIYNNEDLDNLIEGTIKEILYLGDHLRVVMDVAGNDDFIVKVRNKSNGWDISEGQKIKIGWSAEDCKALDAVV